MAQNNREWEALGRDIQNIVDRAVSSQDYQKLNQTIRQTVDKAVNVSGEAVRRAQSRRTVYSQPAQPVVQQKLPALYGSAGNQMTKGVLQVVGGSLLSGFTLLGAFAGMMMELVLGFSASTSVELLPLAFFGGGLLLIRSGAKKIGWAKRFKTYRRTLGQKTHCAIEKLARSVGKSVGFVRKELQQMIDAGLFLEGHLDNEQSNLITSDETYRVFEQSRLQLEQRQRQEAQVMKSEQGRSPQVQEVLDKGNAFIAQIRKCNDDIPGEAISAKIDRMETIVRKIFHRVETNPEVVPDLKKMMDYYLPMTVKLLRAYADMDAQSVQGPNIENSKREIEATLDTLNLAFEKLLDELFADTALDVSSDISVLQTLLAQEGLTEDELSKMKKQNL